MITNNAKVAMLGRMICAPTSAVHNTGIPLKIKSGTTKYFDTKTNIIIVFSSDTTPIEFGSGTTPASETDYALETPLSNITYISTETVGSENGKAKRELTLTLTNENDSKVTIAEIGLFGSAYTCSSTTATTSSSSSILIDRTVLETPVEIAAGGNAVIKYAITAGWPTEA